MQTINTLSDNVAVDVVFSGLDIGATVTSAIATGTDDELHWVSMTGYGNLLFVGQLGTATESDWTASDDVLTITVEQASSATGTGKKTVKAYTMTAGMLDAKGDKFAVEVQAEELDRANNFTHVRVTVAATDNNGTDELNGVYLRYNPRYSNTAKDSYAVQLSYDQAPN
jgi:hypothetical protein